MNSSSAQTLETDSIPAEETNALWPLCCPLDGAPLQLSGAHCQCRNGHTFDFAREGYLNLLTVQNKRSRDPGDSKEMVVARRQFLNAGYYSVIADAIASVVARESANRTSFTCLDAGCGEGYYLRALARHTPHLPSLSYIGLDISKWAVQAAAKQWREARWVVASNARIPVMSNSLDCVLCIFGFPVFPEFARALKPEGALILVDPGPEHLQQLREIIYSTVRRPREETRAIPEGFTLESTASLTDTCELPSSEAIHWLLTMTPHLFRASAQGKSALCAMSALTVDIDISVRVLRRVA